jgi:hypothetical protein
MPAGSDIALGLSGVAASLICWGTLEALTGGAGTGGGGLGAAIDRMVIRAIMTISSLLFGGLALGRLASVVAMTRDLLESGSGHERARLALIESDAERASEKEPVSRGERSRRALAYALAGGATTAATMWLTTLESKWTFVPMVASVLLLMLTAKAVVGQLLEGPSPWSRLMRGRFGRTIFRVARLFTRKKRIQVGVAQPTVAALGLEAESLFQALPPHLRDQFRDLPAILAALRDQADWLRRRDADREEDRVSGIVAAMERVRLDLMGMGAGFASVPDVTKNLEDARRLAERMQRALESRAESSPSRELPEFDTPS